MKRIQLLCAAVLGLSLFFTGCKKDDEPAPPPVVGIWELDRLVESDYPTAYQQYNNLGYDYYVLSGLGSRLDIKGDKTFSEIRKLQGFVDDYEGTWEYTNNTLSVNYTDQDRQDASFTYDNVKNRLMGEKIPVTDTIQNPQTRRPEVVRYNIQFVYIKR